MVEKNCPTLLKTNTCSMAKEKKEPEPPKPAEQRTAFERVQLARHANRPYTLDLIERLFEDFVELHDDIPF